MGFFCVAVVFPAPFGPATNQKTGLFMPLDRVRGDEWLFRLDGSVRERLFLRFGEMLNKSRLKRLSGIAERDGFFSGFRILLPENNLPFCFHGVSLPPGHPPATSIHPFDFGDRERLARVSRLLKSLP